MALFFLDVLFKGFPYITKIFGFVLAIVFFYYGIILNDDEVQYQWQNILVIFCIVILRTISIVLSNHLVIVLAFACGNFISRKYKETIKIIKR